MSEYVERFRSKVNEREIRAAFPEMTDTEEPIWSGSPHPFSMVGHYILALLVMMVHILFYWAAEGDAIDGEGNFVFIVDKVKLILDLFGVFGFVIVVLAIAKINHYLNFSTSSKWTTTWLIVNGMIPFLMVLADWTGKALGTVMDDVIDTPQWLQIYYLLLGFFSGGLLIVLTALYQRSFRYAITDRRIHIRKQFLYFDTSTHGMAFDKIENLKVDPPIIGRIFGFGNVHIVTASGLGLREDESGIGGGLAADGDSLSPGGGGILRFAFGWISAQRQRTTVDQDPADCLYGVSKPLDLYRLINELIDSR